jgi:hypothetical protein
MTDWSWNWRVADPFCASKRILSPSPFGPSFVKLNRESQHARLAVEPIRERIDQLSHLLPEHNQLWVAHRLDASARRVNVKLLKGDAVELS